MVLNHHPDRTKLKISNEVMHRIQKAWEILGDPTKKRNYDFMRKNNFRRSEFHRNNFSDTARRHATNSVYEDDLARIFEFYRQRMQYNTSYSPFTGFTIYSNVNPNFSFFNPHYTQERRSDFYAMGPANDSSHRCTILMFVVLIIICAFLL
ncbi:hypothetical protein EDEG_03387 [Edhazardia aedis USNM 41457]|uniref:J domain-containing protein n=1 Tax=Edhazardia aedis (strain USNM 41457) TaxID=1003232 RepID=J9DLD8_EDHAE|nr:hypothetical protein EDEG_03387 [Edhazardia aedis USNM 41457]|eukprot:EJW02172.1 hypothetical protein EDEG_03387 [Edhazardia aedis USNM 41457]